MPNVVCEDHGLASGRLVAHPALPIAVGEGRVAAGKVVSPPGGGPDGGRCVRVRLPWTTLLGRLSLAGLGIAILIAGAAVAAVAADGGRPPTAAGPRDVRVEGPGPATDAGEWPAAARRAPAADRPFALPFPRVGIWWPDTWRQRPARIARYDYLVLGPWDRENVPRLRARNPDLIALTSTNACELSYDASADADPADNAAVRAVPGEWFLTQVGSELTAAVDARATTLPVRALRAGGVRLFVPGDTVLIDDEVVLVKKVDAGRRVLTVRRGYVRPAAAHSAGTRAAALISFWPGSWLLDVSTYCPSAVAGHGVPVPAGPETWAEYNARFGAALVADPVWDGILVDRSDGDESWLIGESTARSIDPDRSNRLPSDGYAAFDAAWNEGLRRYEERLRELVGDDRLIYVNWGAPNYDLLNGNNFEGFPMRDGTAYGVPWQATVFGPRDGGGYLEWLARSRQPNLSTIQTYEDDGGPDPTGDGSYDNPARRKGFRPDYRKMRFGLCTALLGDGFFSYEVNTNGHASLGLLWFDEYDNAGRRRGYLGRPLGPARRAVGLPTSRVLTRGGRFETTADLRRWELWADEEAGYRARMTLDDDRPATGRSSLRVTVEAASGVDWRVSLGSRVAVRRGLDYTLSFRARADGARELSAVVQQTRSPWRTRIDFGAVRLSTGWRRYVLCAPCRAGDSRADLLLQFGQSLGDVWIDDVRLQVGNAQIWRRDFRGGVALVNAGTRARTVPLHGAFRHIKGRQVPSVNNGKLVRRVRLRPRDGVILLRP